MSNHVAVLPSIHQPWTNRCLRNCVFDTLVVDNIDRNRGVAASWNLGIDEMDRRGVDWLIVMSAAIRFGPPGGADFLDALAANPDAIAVEAAHGIGWHLVAFHRRTIEKVGRFDENFWPAYFEDIDYGRRMWLAFDKEQWPRTAPDVALAGFSHGVDLGGVKIDNRRLMEYYAAKWGGPKGDERFDIPFGRHPIDYWPAP